MWQQKTFANISSSQCSKIHYTETRAMSPRSLHCLGEARLVGSKNSHTLNTEPVLGLLLLLRQQWASSTRAAYSNTYCTTPACRAVYKCSVFGFSTRQSLHETCQPKTESKGPEVPPLLATGLYTVNLPVTHAYCTYVPWHRLTVYHGLPFWFVKELIIFLSLTPRTSTPEFGVWGDVIVCCLLPSACAWLIAVAFKWAT